MIQVYNLHYDMKFLSNFAPIVMVLLVSLMRKNVRDADKRRFISIIIAGLCVIQVFLVIATAVEYQKVYLPYKNMDFQTVEGKISAYETDSVVEKFEINGVKFEYSDKNMMLGYNQIKENGGVINGNGEEVRIDYIRYTGRNVIVSIYKEAVN